MVRMGGELHQAILGTEACTEIVCCVMKCLCVYA